MLLCVDGLPNRTVEEASPPLNTGTPRLTRTHALDNTHPYSYPPTKHVPRAATRVPRVATAPPSDALPDHSRAPLTQWWYLPTYPATLAGRCAVCALV